MAPPKTLLIGTRGSALALAQAGMVRDQVAGLLPGTEVRLEVLKTTGDRLSASTPPEGPPELPAPGVFTKELDEALLSGKIHAAVHSLKDVPTVLPQGLRFAAFLRREDPRDALVSREGVFFRQLAAGSRVGTSSPRREAQIRSARPDLRVLPLRGNVDTRLRKLREGEFEAVVVASAGLKRLGLKKEITECLEPSVMLPAPAQGILCLVVRESGKELEETLRPLDDRESRVRGDAERSFLKTLQGGCRVPVGALAVVEGVTLSLDGVVAHSDGKGVLRHGLSGDTGHPRELGEKLAEKFLASGAGEILKSYGRMVW